MLKLLQYCNYIIINKAYVVVVVGGGGGHGIKIV